VCIGFWWGNLRERDGSVDRDIDGRIILRWIFRKWDAGAWTGFMWLGMGQVAGTRACGNERSGSVKCGECDNRLASQEGVSK
jgi:hypothetical protein